MDNKYICPMHPEVKSQKTGRCPKCGMNLVETKVDQKMKHAMHEEHALKSTSKMSFWEKFKMGMKMTMGMEHTGLAGREMAKLMEEDIKLKFFVSLILTIPIIAYSPLGEKI